MAKIKLLIDTDIFIDALKEIKPARELFRSKEIIKDQSKEPFEIMLDVDRMLSGLIKSLKK